MTYGLGNGTYGKEEDGGLPSSAGGIRQEGAKVSHTKNGKGAPPWRGNVKAPSPYFHCSVFSGRGRDGGPPVIRPGG